MAEEKRKEPEKELSAPPVQVVEWVATSSREEHRGQTHIVEARTWFVAREIAMLRFGVAPEEVRVEQRALVDRRAAVGGTE